MTKTITSKVVQAFLLCPRKAFLLLYSDSESGLNTAKEYAQILETRTGVNRDRHLKTIQKNTKDVFQYNRDAVGKARNILFDAMIESDDLEACCDILTKVKWKSGLGRYSYEPAIVIGTQSVTMEQKNALSFAGYVLGQMQNHLPAAGILLSGDGKAQKIRLGGFYKQLKISLEALRGWMAQPSPEAPTVILNKHCSYCVFSKECMELAVKEDSLSLLDRMTPKFIKKYQKKGIFTLEQLSFLFRPRKSRRKQAAVKFNLELQALAIRTNKIYLNEVSDYDRPKTELFLDFEGIPDENFTYLAGLLISDGDAVTCRSFWADSKGEEQRMCGELLETINQYPDAPIYHYGNYDAKVISSFNQRYGGIFDALTNRLVNVNSWIYGKVYFPVRSNGLKELGKFLGARWSFPDASGLQSLVWRYRWEETGDNNYRNLLITYNEEDCHALRLLVNTVSNLKNHLESNPTIDLADRPKRRATGTGEEIHRQFDWICKSAWVDYDRNKIVLREGQDFEITKKKRGGQKGRQGHIRLIPRTVDKVIQVKARRNCPKHHGHLLRKTGRIGESTIIDLVFSKNGCRKIIIRYEGEKGYCSKCKFNYNPRGIEKFGGRSYGRAFRVWVVYQRIVLRLPYRVIPRVIEDMFGVGMGTDSVTHFLDNIAAEYCETERMMIEQMLQGPFIHADETRISNQGVDHYVWVFTDSKHVVLRMTETREATIVHDFLKGYQGVLISDFYPGYDSVACRQQKCWAHLIRDINEDLWKNPFNAEFEIFVSEVRNLIVPIFKTVDKCGLKKRNLNKFKRSVDRFYKEIINNRIYESEATQKFHKRFDRYQESLFMFLNQDNIPWNNNMAERALRELAVQRKIFGSFSKSVGPQYLMLLGLSQSCRFQEKSFLKFLLSKEKDIDAFRVTKRKKISILAGAARAAVSAVAG